jgi:Bacterial archaeo-eukaryotic release factor family 5
MTATGLARAKEPTEDSVRELLAWRPRHGVFSLYVGADLIDRDRRWCLELRQGLDRAIDSLAGADRDQRLAVEATVNRIEDERFIDPAESEGRGLMGFVEAAREAGEERWYRSQLSPRRTEAHYGARPQVGPLLATLDDGAAAGIAAVSGERVRLFDWHLGRVEQLHDWELELFSGDWRERKAPSPRHPTGGRLVSAAGRDQYDQRLEANRERFAHQTGVLARVSAGKRAWRQILVFGDQRYAGHFADGFGGGCELRHLERTDLVGQPTHLIAERVNLLLPDLNRNRERALIKRIGEAAYAEGRGAFGAEETVQALDQGRVEHLVYDARLDAEQVEPMIELALGTGAAVTPVEGESATAIERQGGVVALLRY